MASLLDCLLQLGVEASDLEEAKGDVQKEFKLIRKKYMKLALVNHPDKGKHFYSFLFSLVLCFLSYFYHNITYLFQDSLYGFLIYCIFPL